MIHDCVCVCLHVHACDTQVGNCYTASVFAGLVSVVAAGGRSLEDGAARVLMFSYGSGFVATAYRWAWWACTSYLASSCDVTCGKPRTVCASWKMGVTLPSSKCQVHGAPMRFISEEADHSCLCAGRASQACRLRVLGCMLVLRSTPSPFVYDFGGCGGVREPAGFAERLSTCRCDPRVCRSGMRNTSRRVRVWR